MRRFQLNLVLFVLTVISMCFFWSCMKEARIVPAADITSKAHTDSTGCIYKDTCKLNGMAGARILANRELVSHGYDITGRVEIAIWREVFEGQHVSGQVSVDPGYVLVGGGADITNLNDDHAGVNALLTAYYPVNDGSFSTFAAESKDHVSAYYHKLWVYAIGMRLRDASGNPLSDSYVRSFMSVDQATSSSKQHPQAYATCPSGYIILSGGAKINWSGAGNLLVGSRPVSNASGVLFDQWTAWAKDHVFVSPATIDAYIVSINPNIPGFGRLVTALKGGIYGESIHKLETYDNAPAGWLISGVGATSYYQGQGRMLYSVYPVTVTLAYAASKDHVANDFSGAIELNYIVIRKE
jgi:hypothetical protein